MHMYKVRALTASRLALVLVLVPSSHDTSQGHAAMCHTPYTFAHPAILVPCFAITLVTATPIHAHGDEALALPAPAAATHRGTYKLVHAAPAPRTSHAMLLSSWTVGPSLESDIS